MSLEKMKVPELRAMAEEMGLELTVTKKAEIIEEIEKFQELQKKGSPSTEEDDEDAPTEKPKSKKNLVFTTNVRFKGNRYKAGESWNEKEVPSELMRYLK